MNETIFKKDSKGKIRTLNIYTLENQIIQISGLVGGKKVINKSTCIGKNIGKSNETTAEEQAILEAKAKLTKKLDSGYFNTEEKAMSEVIILPMLAHSFDKHEKKVIYPCYVQPKLDGMRALGNNGSIISRENKYIETLPHINQNVAQLRDTIDGELYAHGLTFQSNMKLIKKNRGEDSERVKFHVYDLISDDPFIERYERLKEVVSNMNHVKLVPVYIIENKEQLIYRHENFISQGYEGTMIRHGDSGYKVNGRSDSLLKFKDFKDIACEIVDVVPSEKRPTHGKFICEYKGKRFGCGMRMPHEERENILINKQNYIGRKGEIRFFEYTDDGVPRFPVCVGVRLDK